MAPTYETCPNCHGTIEIRDGMSTRYCIHCGTRLVDETDPSYSGPSPAGDGDALLRKVMSAVASNAVIDFRNEEYSFEEVDGVFREMMRPQGFTNEKTVSHYNNACALLAMVVRNDPNPYVVMQMTTALATLESQLCQMPDISEFGMRRDERNKAMLGLYRNVCALQFQIKDERAAKDQAVSESVRATMAGNGLWKEIAAKASDTLMTAEEPKKRTLFGAPSSENSKVFAEYVKAMCRGQRPYRRSSRAKALILSTRASICPWVRLGFSSVNLSMTLPFITV